MYIRICTHDCSEQESLETDLQPLPSFLVTSFLRRLVPEIHVDNGDLRRRVGVWKRALLYVHVCFGPLVSSDFFFSFPHIWSFLR